MNLSKIPKPGTSPVRKIFFDQARETVLSLQKIAGRNVTVNEHPGKGTVINAERGPGAALPPVSCPPCIRLTFHEISICGCGETGTSASMLVTEINGGLNGFSVDLIPQTETVCAEFFGWGDYCSYLHQYADQPAPLHAVVTTGDTCSGSLITEDDHWPFVRVLFLEGVWYVFAHLWDTPEPAALFSGSVSNFGDAIPNEVYCTPDRNDLVRWQDVNPIVACHGPTNSFGNNGVAGFAYDGTITLESITCP